MAGRGPRYHANDGPRRATSPDPPSGPGPARPSSSNLDPDNLPSAGGPPRGLQNTPMVIEQKLASQHAEIQRLLTENQRLAVTHVALRQELAAAQQEIRRLQHGRSAVDTEKEQRFAVTQVALRQELAEAKHEVHRLQEAINAIGTEKDQQIRAALEKSAQIEGDLQATESLKGDLEKIRSEREELAARVEQLTEESRKIPVKDEEIAALKSEVDELRQKHQQARMDFELQKKVSFERLELKQAMEKNVFTMAREVEKLRMELANADRRAHAAHAAHAALLASSGGTNAPPAHHNTMPQSTYENNYVSQQEAIKNAQSANRAENKAGNEASKYPTGLDDFHPLMQNSEDHPTKPSANTDPAAEWSAHAAPNGKAFYYNSLTGATQWDKPPAASGAETHALHQRQLQQVQGQNQQSAQALSPSLQQQPLSPATMQQGTQVQSQQATYAEQHALSQLQAQQSLSGQGQNPVVQVHSSAQSQFPHSMHGNVMQQPPSSDVQAAWLAQSPSNVHMSYPMHPSSHSQMQQLGQAPSFPRSRETNAGIADEKFGQQSHQLSHVNSGTSLLIFGIPEGYNDRDLAGLFHPYGTVLHAKVAVENATGHGKGYGVVSLESPQAADASVAALNGIFILGKRIKVEIQHRDQESLHHQSYPQPLLQQSMMPGGIGPIRWHQRGGFPGRWPY